MANQFQPIFNKVHELEALIGEQMNSHQKTKPRVNYYLGLAHSNLQSVLDWTRMAQKIANKK